MLHGRGEVDCQVPLEFLKPVGKTSNPEGTAAEEVVVCLGTTLPVVKFERSSRAAW